MDQRGQFPVITAMYLRWGFGSPWMVLGWLLLVACLCFTTGCERRGAAPIRIGFLLDEPSSISQVTREAAELAVATINAAGGIVVDGRAQLVEMIVGGTDNTPEGATRASLELINQEQVVAIIGSNFSRNAIPAGEVAEQAGIPMICPGSSHPQTTAGRRFVFRITFVDAFQGRAMAHFARRELGLATAAVLYDVADTYSREIAMVFRRDFENFGGEVVAFEFFTSGDQDFVPPLERIRDASPEALFLPNFSAEIVPQVRQARRLGIDAVFLGSDGWPTESPRISSELEGAFFSLCWHPDMALANPKAAEFIDSYRSAYDSEPDDLSAMTYDAFGVLFEAISTAASTDPVAIRDALAQTVGYPGVTGPITFLDAAGDPRRGAAIVQIRNGAIELFRTVDADPTR